MTEQDGPREPASERGAEDSARLGMVGLLVLVVVTLAISYLVLQFVEFLVHLTWETLPDNIDPDPLRWAYIVAVPTLAGAVVGILRRGHPGHSPLTGFEAGVISPRQFPAALGAILVSLAGGAVLGPEIAVMTVGATAVAVATARAGVSPDRRAISLGALAALSSLAVDPIVFGDMTLHPQYSFAVSDLLWALVAAVIAACLVQVARTAAWQIIRLRGGDRASWRQIALGGLALGLIGLVYTVTTGEGPGLVLTSGESKMTALLGFDSLALIVATVAAKTAGYAVSQGFGMRGGPYFPVFFSGVGVGAALVAQVDAAAAPVATAALVAATTRLASAGWPITIVIGVGIGLIFGGPAALPAAVLGAATGRLVPRFGEADPQSLRPVIDGFRQG